MPSLAIAVVGVGHLGKEHARILSTIPGVQLVGVADANEEQAQSIARKYGCKSFSSHRPLLQLVDAAVVAVPTAHHFPIASEFLRCGIPLLVEKPLARSLDEAEELVRLAHNGSTILQVGHIERFNPAYEALARLPLQPRFIQCERVSGFTGRSTDIGVVLDLMIHDLDLLLAITGSSVRSVESLGVSVFGLHEDVANARLQFNNGCVATVTASRASYAPKRCMQIWSPEGFVQVDFAKRQLTLVQPSDQVRRDGLDPRKLDPPSFALLKEELFGRHLQLMNQDCNIGGPDALTRELQQFVSCVRTGKRPTVSGEEARDAIALASRIVSELRQHAWNGDSAGPCGPTDLPKPRGGLFAPSAVERAA